MRPSSLPFASVAAMAALLLLLAGCAASDWSSPHPEPSAIGSIGAGFAPSAAPTPEATIRPRAGSWSRVHPSSGYRVVLVTAGDDSATRTLVATVRAWASAEEVDLRVVRAKGDLIAAIVSAIDLRPDLIVSAGNDLVDPLATVTASHLDREFLVLGAEVAEPTANVTAVDWTGASFRGEGLGASSEYDPRTFTAKRCGEAVRAGVAAVLHGLTGIVLWID